MRSQRVLVIGAGIAGLVTAVELACRGLEVIVLERAGAPGGKMRRVEIAGAHLDAGPTVLTMRPVFEAIFAEAGTSLDAHVTLRPLEILARHAWSATERLDLFADVERSVDAIGAFAGTGEAERYRTFCVRARRIYETLEPTFMHAQRPANPLTLAHRVARRGFGDLRRIEPFSSFWRALGAHFHDPRLRQLFGRFATYVGSSPFAAPATLMLIAHAEQGGVWQVEGGMHRLALALAELARAKGATIRYGTEVAEVILQGGRVAGVRLGSGEPLEASAVVVNADVAALAGGLFGPELARAVPKMPRAGRSLSALTWNLVAETEGFPLVRHNVFFSGDYRAEFDDLFQRARLPRAPTVYVCAQDRDDRDGAPPEGPERLLCLVNAPPNGDLAPLDPTEISSCEQQTFDLMERAGFSVRRRPETTLVTTPADFEQLFPGTGGALYGAASHGWLASFRRPAARSRIPGLYLAGGSAHPGAGVPMAALSGRLAAASLFEDYASTSRSRPGATPGGTSTR